MNIVLFIAAIFVAWLIFKALIQILRVGITTAVTLTIIVVLLEFIFGINPRMLFQEITELPQVISHLLNK
jgi:hypothetical protein